MLYLLNSDPNTFGGKIILAIIFAVLAYLLLYFAFRMTEMAYVIKHKKPLYNHFYFYLKKLDEQKKYILKNRFAFYKNLSKKEKKYFEHRVALFIKDKDFIGIGENVITDEMRVLISATAVMLTFGFRDFYIAVISKIVVYPKQFYSNTNKAYHRGEFNPKLKTLVISWEDFKAGFSDQSYNLNLGIHEFTHAIHINSIKQRDISSTIFSDTFKELTKLLSINEALRDRLMASNYFRTYVFTDKFEFVAVIIENFIETPQEFKLQFPIVYAKVRQMLNFNVAGY
ncbi:zinc-dependent peptidase [Gelatiniphilus marinus]|uniref:Zinc-dependent peptidase n=1 Tax=Gelatiniphilus marinus TaxID=1759464 RepID=A0ABW5JUW8_9FLAO